MQYTQEYLNFLIAQIKKHAKKSILQTQTTIHSLETLLETLTNLPTDA